jgi:hypothetical protein
MLCESHHGGIALDGVQGALHRVPQVRVILATRVRLFQPQHQPSHLSR